MNFSWTHWARCIFLGIVTYLMGYPVCKDGVVNWNNIFILFLLSIIFNATDTIAEKKAKQVLTDEE